MDRASAFIKTAQPKKEIREDPLAFRRILDAGWWGQMKIHGHHAQIHLSSNQGEECLVYNRHGKLHARSLDEELSTELRRILHLESGWSAIEAEWLKNEKKLFLFDYIKFNGQVLSSSSYEERYQLLPRLYRSDCIATLPVLRTVEECLQVMKNTEPYIEGLVFKSRCTVGFSSHSIVRCRKTDRRNG
ncbi:MAG: hypothetical protein HYW48_00260 [Deltaproteobacteria bacterium]|nr:hypothetical protein [Deltaproteobacteria bacterium]